jgi:hypothetical protein
MLVRYSAVQILLSQHIFMSVTGYNSKFGAQCNITRTPEDDTVVTKGIALYIVCDDNEVTLD